MYIGGFKLGKYDLSFYENPDNKINVKRLDSNTVVSYYKKYISDKVFRFDLSNEDILFVPFRDSNFCHLAGFHKLGYDGLDGFLKLEYTNIDFGKINNHNIGPYKQFIKYQDRPKYFNKIYDMITNYSNLNVVYNYEKPTHSNMDKLKHILVMNDDNKKNSYHIGLGISDDGTYYPNTFIVNKGSQFDKFTKNQTIEQVIYSKEYDYKAFSKIFRKEDKKYFEKISNLIGTSDHIVIAATIDKNAKDLQLINKEINRANTQLNKHNNLLNKITLAEQKDDKELLKQCKEQLQAYNYNSRNDIVGGIKGIHYKITELNELKGKIGLVQNDLIHGRNSFNNIRYRSILDLYSNVNDQVAITKEVARDIHKLNINHGKVLSLNEITEMKDNRLANKIHKSFKPKGIERK